MVRFVSVIHFGIVIFWGGDHISASKGLFVSWGAAHPSVALGHNGGRGPQLLVRRTRHQASAQPGQEGGVRMTLIIYPAGENMEMCR